MDQKEKQSDGTLLTPFEQALRYANDLTYREKSKWIIVTNFTEIRIHDMDSDNPANDYQIVFLENIDKEYTRLNFLVDPGDIFIKKEIDLSIKAGTIIGKIYDALLNKCDTKNESILHDLNKFCVKLVFLLYADDANILSYKNQFRNYVLSFKPQQLADAFQILFITLNTPENERNIDHNFYFNNPDLLTFPYIDGGLFANDKPGFIPVFDQEIFDILVNDAISNFNWSGISPTIFGAVFESTLNPDTRRQGGMHYTSTENIHKVIDPLFLDDLKFELEKIKSVKVFNTQKKQLNDFLKKLGSLTFFDPACGSGNFLTETYISLRKLENEALNILACGQEYLVEIINVSLDNFYGIEINDFAVSVAKTALWIAENQMLQETISITKHDIDLLPLKSYSNIVKSNALRLNWEDIIPKNKCNYIIGNPPFSGARIMSSTNKQDLLAVFGSDWEHLADLDYVTGWYKSAIQYIQNTNIKVCFVSTNSITQGEQVQILWERLFKDYIFHIIFAYKTFIWNSESISKAHVNCVIVAFSFNDVKDKFIIDNDIKESVDTINPYLSNYPNIFITTRKNPISDIPELKMGNQPIDNGNYLFTEGEMQNFIDAEPKAKKFFRPWYGSREFLYNKPRYCLFIAHAEAAELKKMPLVLERIENVREFRSKSKSSVTKSLADRPAQFNIERIATQNYLVIPEVSSAKRRYIPIDFLNCNLLASNLLHIIENANLYHFAILTSSVHMLWLKTVGGRLKSDYRYSRSIVYNNFPWPKNPKDTSKIETLAKNILDIRANYSNSCLADLYDPNLMPADLRKAHKNLDNYVLFLYELKHSATDNEILNKLFSMYKEVTTKKE